ncbi:ABC transporter ATP-binding protein/permease [Reichenbachiella agarivorans]|uniref:ABC transporter ATP-binding protein/permease n=1 Tax=Reichenbachiella agarivorans TaxID=2979464 RepID=A0ABY6CQ73_9BACT|nr:ABC transporter ATP-binding protein [Reichenbachiella agarivorans]UXP32657.1 ABC transporter ATP-binding protein/permease [Reichenbachiella agarivorans]
MHKKSNSLSTWIDYFSLYGDKKKYLLFAIILAIIQSFVLIPSTYFVQQIFDVGLASNNLGLILRYSIMALFLILINQALWLWGRKIVLKITKEIIASIRSGLLIGILQSDYSAFQTYQKNKLHNQIINDSERVDRMSNAFVAIFIPSFFSSICLLAVLFYLNWTLSIVLLLLGPALWLMMKLLRKGIRDNTNNFNNHFERFSSQLRFIIHYFDLIKSSAFEEQESQEKTTTIKNLKDSSQSMAWQQELFKSLQDIIISCVSLLILVIGCFLVLNDQLTFGTLMSFYFVLYLLRRFMFNLSQSIPEILSGKESLAPIMELTKTLSSTKEVSGTKLIDLENTLELENISFHYPSQKSLLSKLNLQIQKGKTYAIIGSNGVGKSTLIKLIMGFYKLNHGQILIDGHPLTKVDIKHWRNQIGLIFQESYIFDQTVKENILYGYNENISDEELEQIIKLSTLDRVISKLPNGVDTQLNSAINLSGGEKQKIAIARSLVSQPNLLILDEPTNHLDSESLKQLYVNLKNLWFKPAILIITHNKDFLDLADEVLELKDGVLHKYDLK